MNLILFAESFWFVYPGFNSYYEAYYESRILKGLNEIGCIFTSRPLTPFHFVSWCQAVEEELCKILDSGKTSYVPKKGHASVVLFVGLQGMDVVYLSNLTRF